MPTVIIPQPHKLYIKNSLPQQHSNMAYVAYEGWMYSSPSPGEKNPPKTTYAIYLNLWKQQKTNSAISSFPSPFNSSRNEESHNITDHFSHHLNTAVSQMDSVA